MGTLDITAKGSDISKVRADLEKSITDYEKKFNTSLCEGVRSCEVILYKKDPKKGFMGQGKDYEEALANARTNIPEDIGRYNMIITAKHSCMLSQEAEKKMKVKSTGTGPYLQNTDYTTKHFTF